MTLLNMKITNCFFNPRPSNLDATTMHTTWRNPNASNPNTCLTYSHAQILFSTEYKDATQQKFPKSDHTSVILQIHINKLAFKMKDKELTTKTDWEKS
jgi:hypothetical protein